MKQWKEEHCTSKPVNLQIIAPNTFMERRNIRRVDHEANPETEREAYTEYVCESREIGTDEYGMLKAIEEIDTKAAIDDYTMQLIEEGLL